MTNVTFFDSCSGIGGFHLALSKLGFHCVGFSEIDKYAIQTYNKNFPGFKNYGDINRINPKELPDFDIFCGGFPCQPFSVAGKERGFDDARGNIFLEIARIVREKKPRLLLLENVRGLLTNDKGKTYQIIRNTLDEMGYTIEWQLLNSKYFIPQNRERIIIIGHLRGRYSRKIFPVGTTSKESDRRKWKTKKQITNTLQTPGHSAGNYRGMNLIAIPVMAPDRKNKNQNGRVIKEDGEPMFTLTVSDIHGIFDGFRVRRLTPKECERLQTFPDDFTEGVSDTQRYKQTGNAVTVDVIHFIGEKIINSLLA